MNEGLSNLRWQPPGNWLQVDTIDMHTGGEPLRIIVGGIPDIPGQTILEKRRYFRKHLEPIRTSLMWEPRGHADMYGAVLTAPVTPDGHLGVFFMHNEGYSTMCGHAIIALVKFALETGLVEYPDDGMIRMDAPPGRIVAFAEMEDKKVVKTSFLNVPSFVLLEDKIVHVPGVGEVRLDVAYGGAFYAFVDAGAVGLELTTRQMPRIIDLGKKIKKAVARSFDIVHPFEADLSFLYGTIFTGKAENEKHHSRNVCVFANGEVDRSATGSGVSARAALHAKKDGLEKGEKLVIESIIGTTMEVEIAGVTSFGPYPAVIPKVSGTAFFTGQHRFLIDPDDPFREGFFIR
jgi:proline racemase